MGLLGYWSVTGLCLCCLHALDQSLACSGSDRQVARITLVFTRPGCVYLGLLMAKFHVTSVVETRFEWKKVMGNVDGAAWAILCGHMTYPREAWALRQVWRLIHGSWSRTT